MLTRYQATALALTCFAAAFGAACHGGNGGGDEAILADVPSFAVGVTPALELADDGSAERQFTRVLTARLPNGDLLAADGGSKELRVFRDGVLQARLSRQGNGPGELQDIQRIALAHDTIFVMALPMVSRHINIFSTGSGFMARHRLRPQEGAPSFVPIDRLATGAFLVEEGRGFTAISQEPPIGQLLPDSVTLGLFRPGADDSTGIYRSLGRFFRHHTVAFRTPGMPMPFSMSPYSLGATTSWAVAGDVIWIGEGATGAMRAFDGEGRLVVEAALPVTQQSWDQDALRRARDAAITGADTEMQRAAAEAIHDPALRPATMPVLDAMVPGPDGEVWVRRYRLERRSGQEFLVMSRTGRIVGQVLVPDDVTVHQAGQGFFVGVRRDEDGVESVVEYRLTRN
ncbi:MAG: hypothetical protein ABR551_06695 [Gemmatimonadales bacterium]